MSRRWGTRIKAERPEWKLRWTRLAPKDEGGLASTVIVQDGDRTGKCVIAWNQCFIDDLGHHLPFGISYAFPVHLRLIRDGSFWIVRAFYFDRKDAYDLWYMVELPKWARISWYGNGRTNSKEEKATGSHGRPIQGGPRTD